MELTPIGRRALLVEVEDPAAALDLALWAREHLDAGEVVPAARTVLLDEVADVEAAVEALDRWLPGRRSGAGPVVEVPTIYDGADLEDVGRRWGCSVDDVVARHVATDFVVAFCGFAPGFGYLSGLPDELAVPRLDEPRTRVPAGAVGLADTWCGVYPTGSPGGWRLLGRTDAPLWDVRRDPPALLAPGARVRFVRVG